MKSISFKVFEGRSIYSHRKCIKLNLDMEGSEKIPDNQLHNFMNKLLELFPKLYYHQCSLKEPYGFIKNFNEVPCLHHLCGHLAVALQNSAGFDVSFCTESSLNSKDFYTVYEYEYKNTGIEAGKIAVDIINSLMESKSLNLPLKLSALRDTLKNEISKDSTFDANMDREIPIIAITGTNGKTTTTRLIAYALSKAGYEVGMTTTDGIYINGKCIYEGDTTGPRSAHEVLESNEIDVAVLETARGGLVREGLAYNLADVAVITNIADDHLGLDGIETLEDLARAKMLVGEAVKTKGFVVINGDNEISANYIDRIESNIIIFTENKDNKILRENINKGGYGIFISNDKLCIEHNNAFSELIPVEDIGIAVKGALKYNIQNSMAACGALLAINVPQMVIREALKNFKCDEKLNPGRFNSFDVNGVQVILDYGHNIDGYKCVLEGISKIKHNKLIGVIGVPGDRLDRTTIEVGRIAGSYFDRIFIKEDKDKRGRFPGEVSMLIKEGVLSSCFDINNLKLILDEEKAFKEALDSARPGDIVIVFFEDYAPLLKLVKIKIAEDSRQPFLT